MDKPLTTRWVGLDWADKAHRLVVVDDAGTVLASWSTPHTPTGIAELVRRLRRHGPVAGIAIERKHHLVVHALVQAGFVVYPINPALSSRWGREVSVAGSKSEFADARNLADGLRLRHGRLRRLIPDDPLTRELALSCRHECQLIAEQTRHVNHLQALLKDYYPAAWGWFSDWTCPTAWDFVLTYPTPQALADATTQKLVGFLSLNRSIWARAFYNRCRAKGHSDAQARRNLGEKWLKIIFRMWQTRTPYDEATYLASLIRRGSPLIEDIRST